MQRNCYDCKCDMFKMVKTNQDINDEHCIRNNGGVVAVSDEDKKIAWESYHEKFPSIVFVWYINSLSQAHTVSGATCLIDKDLVRKSVSKMKNGKATGTSGLVQEMVKAAEEARVD